MFKYKYFKISIIIFIILVLFQTNFVWNLFNPIFYKDHIYKLYSKYDVDPLLVAAVIKEESKFSSRAISRAGAIGLMQLMPATALEISSDLGVSDYKEDILYDPYTNIEFGYYYLSKLKKYFKDDLVLTLCAYNAGINNVLDWTKQNYIAGTQDIPYKETRGYVKKVMRTYKYFKNIRKVKRFIQIV